jgi:hypothetical protein
VAAWKGSTQSDVPTITRWSGVTFAVSTALLGGALGALPDILASDPGAGDFLPRLWTSVVLLAAGSGALWVGVRLWRRREDLLRRRGTAYILEETAAGWIYEEKATFLADVKAQFPAVKHIPGPSTFQGPWHWSLGDEAGDWDERVDQLVVALWTLQFNDEDIDSGSLFVWAWWSVALAFGARATSGRRRRSPMLIRQRPSLGAQGALDLKAWHDKAHLFEQPSTLEDKETFTREVRLHITSQNQIYAGSATAPPPSILLVRMTRTTFGSELHVGTPESEIISFEIGDAVGLHPPGEATTVLHELRCLPKTSRFHAWEEFPALAGTAVDWVAETAEKINGPILLGLLVPQEIAVGMGILIADGANRQGVPPWPVDVWPLHPVDKLGRLVVPKLDLGRNGLTVYGP